MTSIWLVTADNGGAHEAEWPVRAFASRAEAEAWVRAEERRLAPGVPPGDPDWWRAGQKLHVAEVPFGPPAAAAVTC